MRNIINLPAVADTVVDKQTLKRLERLITQDRMSIKAALAMLGISYAYYEYWYANRGTNADCERVIVFLDACVGVAQASRIKKIDESTNMMAIAGIARMVSDEEAREQERLNALYSDSDLSILPISDDGEWLEG